MALPQDLHTWLAGAGLGHTPGTKPQPVLDPLLALRVATTDPTLDPEPLIIPILDALGHFPHGYLPAGKP